MLCFYKEGKKNRSVTRFHEPGIKLQISSCVLSNMCKLRPVTSLVTVISHAVECGMDFHLGLQGVILERISTPFLLIS
jgi:hypothetical protein